MMATTIQHTPVVLQQQEDEDIALANYLTNGLRFDQPQEAWTYPQQLPQQAFLNNPYYYQQQQQQMRHSSNNSNGSRSRTRKSSNQVPRDIHVQKSVSTPISPSSSSSTRSRKSMQPSNKHSLYNTMSSNNSVSSATSSTSGNQRPKSMMHMSPSERRRNSSATLSNLSNCTSPATSEYNSGSRRPSVTSVVSSSNVSISSEMSVNTKLSLSKRLRKVFSMSNLRSSKDLSTLNESPNESNVSLVLEPSISTASSITSTRSTNNPKSFRRRSIASLSNLFQKNAVSPPEKEQEEKTAATSPPPPAATNVEKTAAKKKSSNRRHSSGDLREMANNKKLEKKDRPELRVDTQVPKKKGGLKARTMSPSVAGGTPDSPNSGISPFSRLPPPQQQQQQQQRFVETLPSPTPSSSSSSARQDETPLPPPIGLHYGVGLHSSPKLKPATSSTSSLVTDVTTTKRRIQFCNTIQVHETFTASDYDRRCDNNATCQKLTPLMAMKIKQELNEYKLTEMEVHIESRQYTHFFL